VRVLKVSEAFFWFGVCYSCKTCDLLFMVFTHKFLSNYFQDIDQVKNKREKNCVITAVVNSMVEGQRRILLCFRFLL